MWERYGRLPDSTAYDTVMGSKRLTKSSLAQMRNPYLVINLKKEKTNNKNSDAQVVINDCRLVMQCPHLNNLTKWRGMFHPNRCFLNASGAFISHLSQNYCPETRPWKNIKLVIVLICNLGNIWDFFLQVYSALSCTSIQLTIPLHSAAEFAPLVECLAVTSTVGGLEYVQPNFKSCLSF